MDKRSPIWNYFKICEDETKAICQLCNAVISRGGGVSKKSFSTSALHNHLFYKHQNEYKPIMEQKAAASALIMEQKAAASASASSTSDTRLMESAMFQDIITNTDAIKIMDKREILDLMRMNSPRLSFVPNFGKSEVWRYFVNISCDNMRLNYVKCTRCDCIMKWKSRDGTSGLRIHVDSCTTQPKVAPAADSQMLPEERSAKSRSVLPEQAKSELLEAVVRMCAKDLLPLHFVEGEGFQQLMQKCVAFGAKYKQAASSLTFPSAETISQHISIMMEDQKYHIISEVCSLQTLGVTVDRYPNYQESAHRYMSVTVHFLDTAWKRRSFVLNTLALDDTSTAKSVEDFVYDTLHENSCNRETNYIFADNSLGLKTNFDSYRILDCACYNLEQALVSGLSESNVDLPREIHELIRNCKDLLSHLKQMKNSLQLSINPLQHNNTVMAVLKTVAEHLTSLDIKSFQADDSERILCTLAVVDSTLLKDTIAVLERFQKAATLLTAEDTPTLQLVIPVRNQLSEHLNPNQQDSESIVKLKETLKQQLNQHFNVSDIHCMAALLDPRLKNKCTLLNFEERTRAISLLQSMLPDVTFELKQEPDPTSSSSGTAHDDGECSSSTPKRIKLSDSRSVEDDFFGDMFSPGSGSNSRSESELDQYINTTETCTDVISYWISKSQKWPHLSYLVRCVLGMPACNSSCGHIFLLPNRAEMEERLVHLDSESAHGVLFLRSLKDRI